MPPQCQMEVPAIEQQQNGRVRAPLSTPLKAGRQRARKDADDSSPGGSSSRLMRMASMELEVLRAAPDSSPSNTTTTATPRGAGAGATASSSLTENLRPFPPACRQLLFGIEGNARCVDCGDLNPDWASVSYGALLCLGCSGHHRNLGVKTSFVRSVSMDHWSHSQILRMLEGGNAQLGQFFARHRLPAAHAGASTHRYRTVAARFYREKLAEHASSVGEGGEYRGRERARSGSGGAASSSPPPSSSSSSSATSPPQGNSLTKAAEERPRSSSAPRLEKVEEGRALSASSSAAPRVRSGSPNIADAVAERQRERQLRRSMTA